jgi:hypothetical protein
VSCARRPAHRAALLVALVAAGLGLLAACGTEVSSEPIGAVRPTQTSIHPLPVTIDPSTSSVLEEPRSPASFVTGADGVVRPDPEYTIGAVFADVNEDMVCNEHYTQGVRQPRFNDKVEAFAAYGISIGDRDTFQLDHLVPISLGGSNERSNLWPQPYDDTAGAVQKDELERHLRGLVCSRRMALAEAQALIVADWWAAREAVMALPIDPGTEGPEPWRPFDPTTGAVANGALCDQEGVVGYTEPKKVPLTCSRTDTGELRWLKRY